MERVRFTILGAGMALAMAGAGWLAWQTLAPPPRASALPVLGATGEFTLTDQAGGRFGSAQLRGAPWIACVVFTRCQGPCPMIAGRMAALDREVPAAVRLVTVTADPRHDTPAVLRRYIADRGWRTARWTFLTGSVPGVKGLLRDRFRLPAGEPGVDRGTIVIPHTEKLVLVDGAGGIRGYYESGDPAELDRLRLELRRLLAERPGAPATPTGG